MRSFCCSRTAPISVEGVGMQKAEKEGCKVAAGKDENEGGASRIVPPKSDRCPYCGFRSGSPHELLVHIFQCHPG